MIQTYRGVARVLLTLRPRVAPPAEERSFEEGFALEELLRRRVGPSVCQVFRHFGCVRDIRSS